ncbi:Yippee putative zinc-binding protein [Paragonimus kellicotti]|nr:Yippee putative zinc-binding protein [Paragonimus kellicotti]
MLGWKYERAFEASQRYKEGKVIIELAHLIKDNGWDADWLGLPRRHLSMSSNPSQSPTSHCNVYPPQLSNLEPGPFNRDIATTTKPVSATFQPHRSVLTSNCRAFFQPNVATVSSNPTVPSSSSPCYPRFFSPPRRLPTFPVLPLPVASSSCAHSGRDGSSDSSQAFTPETGFQPDHWGDAVNVGTLASSVSSYTFPRHISRSARAAAAAHQGLQDLDSCAKPNSALLTHLARPENRAKKPPCTITQSFAFCRSPHANGHQHRRRRRAPLLLLPRRASSSSPSRASLLPVASEEEDVDVDIVEPLDIMPVADSGLNPTGFSFPSSTPYLTSKQTN